MASTWAETTVVSASGHAYSDDTGKREVPCPARCRDGIVLVDGFESDCIECGGFGNILVQ